MLSDGRKTITYNPANKPISIKLNGDNQNRTSFFYNSSGNRYKKTFGNNGMSETHYIGKLFERTYPTNNANYIDKNFIYFGGKLIKIKEKSYSGILEPTVITESFIHQDNLGNVIAITDKDGKITNRRSYTPFGSIRHLLYKEGVEKGNNLTSTQMLEQTTNRSFTGHESIEGFDGLVHMNGRVYDSSIGRFLSADPFIQAPTDTQSYNRYSYVKNNPLNYTDPSGYFWGIGSWVKKNFKTVVAIAAAVIITVATQGAGAPAAWGSFFGNQFASVVATGALAGAASGAIMTGTIRGTLEGALWGGVAAGAAFGVAHMTSSVMGISPADAHSATFFKAGMKGASAFKAVAHGLSRAAIAKMRYGTGKGAFLSGFVTSGFSVGGGAGAKGAVAMAVVGGTASVIGGGKFANGAMGSAFQYLFNDSLNHAAQKGAEKSRIGSLSSDKFRSEMNFEGADEYVIMAQDKLGKQIMINELSGLLDASKGMYGNIITPRPEPSTLFNILNLFDTTSTLKFEYNCHTYNNCGVKIYEKK